MTTIEIFSRAEELLSLKTEWERLAHRSELPMLSYDWAEVAALSLEKREQLVIAVLRDGSGNLRAIAPLLIRGSKPDYLTSLLNHFVAEPAGLLYESAADLNVLMRGVLRLGYPIRIRRLPLDTARLLCLRSPAITLLRKEPSSPLLRLRGDWRSFEEALPSRRRSDLRRAERRAEAFGALRVEVSSPSIHTVKDCLALFHRIEAQSWKQREGTAVLLDPKVNRFFAGLCSSFAAKGRLRFAVLYLGGEPAASQVALCYGGSLWVLKIAHNEQMRVCSPGLLLTHRFIQSAFEERLEAFEFLGVDEPWIHTWTRDYRDYRTLLEYPCSFRSAAALGSQLLKSIRVRLIETGRRADA